MSPAITAVNFPENEDETAAQVCVSCLGLLTETALKCKNCQALVHLRCSGMPEYQLVRFAVTQAAYTCGKCVKSKDMNEERFEAELTKIRETMAMEESIIEQTQREADRNTLDDTNGNEDQNNQNVNTIVNSDSSKKPEAATASICRYYIKRECKYGRAGNECKFRHPKICPRFSKDGDRKAGCKKGSSCSDFHPKACWESMERKECSRIKCRYFHLNGTKGTYENQTHEMNDRFRKEISSQRSNEPSYADKLRTERYHREQYPRTGRYQQEQYPRTGQNPVETRNTVINKSYESDPSRSNQDFFLMDQRMQRLETMVVTILQSVRPPGAMPRLPDHQ